MESFEDLGFSKVDFDREKRQGFPEVIYGEEKQPSKSKLSCVS